MVAIAEKIADIVVIGVKGCIREATMVANVSCICRYGYCSSTGSTSRYSNNSVNGRTSVIASSGSRSSSSSMESRKCQCRRKERWVIQ